MREDMIYCGANLCRDVAIATQKHTLYFSKPSSAEEIMKICRNGTFGTSNLMFSSDLNDIYAKYVKLTHICSYVVLFNKHGDMVNEYIDEVTKI